MVKCKAFLNNASITHSFTRAFGKNFIETAIFWQKITTLENQVSLWNVFETTPYKMDTYSLDGASLPNCRLEYGSAIFYPETENDSDSKVRIFNDLMAYAMLKNDYNTGTQLNLANCNSLFPLIYIDLTYQTEKVTRDPKQLIFRYRLSANVTQNLNVRAIVLFEEILKTEKTGNELVIV